MDVRYGYLDTRCISRLFFVSYRNRYRKWKRMCRKYPHKKIRLLRSPLKLVSLFRPSRACSTGGLMLLLLPGHVLSRLSKRAATFVVVQPKRSEKVAVELLTFLLPVLIAHILPRLFVALRRLWIAQDCAWRSLSVKASPLGRGNGSIKSLIVLPMERFLC